MNKKNIIILFLLVASINLCYGQILNESSSQKVKLCVPRNDIQGLKNFAKVSDTLYRGAQPAREGFKKLKEMGVKTIVNLRGFHSDRELIKGLGFKYVHISFKTWHPEDEDVIKFLKAVTSKENQPVFVHCLHGADRTGMMTAIYRVYVQAWTVEEAMKELPNFGFHEMWDGIKEYLNGFNKEKIEKLLKKS